MEKPLNEFCSSSSFCSRKSRGVKCHEDNIMHLPLEKHFISFRSLLLLKFYLRFKEKVFLKVEQDITLSKMFT